MRKLIALIPTGGKTKEEMIRDVINHPEVQKIFKKHKKKLRVNDSEESA